MKLTNWGLASLIFLAGCCSDSSCPTAKDVTDVANLSIAAANVGIQAANLANAVNGSSTPTTYAAAGQQVTVPNNGGYSQVGAFNDCQRLYGAVGQAQLAAQCAQNAANMSSLN